MTNNKPAQTRIAVPCDDEMIVTLSMLRTVIEIEQGRLMSYAELLRFAIEQLALQKNVNVRKHSA